MLGTFEKALNALHEDGVAKHGEHWMGLVRGRLTCLEEAYQNLTVAGRPPIDYSDLTTRAAYVFAYGMPRAYFAAEFLARHRAALGAPLLAKPKIKVVSFGGGPGSELVGLLHYLGDAGVDEGVNSVSYRVYDKDGDWRGVAEKTVEGTDSDIEVDMAYHALDLTDAAASAQVDISDADLIIFSYIMSELCALEANDAIAKNTNSILGKMTPGTTMLFIESKQTEFIKYFKECKGFYGKEKNEEDDGLNITLPQLLPTFQNYRNILNRTPRMQSDSIISKWYVKN